MRRLFRLSYPTIAAMAWKNRDELLDWAGFGVRAVRAAATPGGATIDDVRTEARVRFAFTRDRRTRRADGLRVEVRDGVATLWGVVDPDVHDLAPEIAADVVGVRDVDNRMRVPKRAKRRAERRARRDDVDAVSYAR